MLFASVINAYLDSEKFDSLAPNTKRGYRRTLILAERYLGDVAIDAIRPRLVQAFLDGLRRTPGEQYVARNALKAVEKWAAGPRELLPQMIMTGVEIVGPKGGHKPWTFEQVACAESGASPHLSRAITLGANTGQRGSDLIKMRWTDIEEVEGRPGINVVPMKLQGKLKLWIPFTAELIGKMAGWERQPGMILRKFNGLPYDNRQQLTDAWVRERERPEMESLRELHLHGLRGTAVVRLKQAGATIPDICAMVGMTPKTVETYCRFSVQRENALRAVERLDASVIPFSQKIPK
jgi:integrase